MRKIIDSNGVMEISLNPALTIAEELAKIKVQPATFETFVVDYTNIYNHPFRVTKAARFQK